MKRLFWMLFPKRTESMDEFIDFVLRNACARIEVAATHTALSQPGMAGVSMFAVFSSGANALGTAYDVCCVAVAPDGKRMKYNHMHVVQYVSPCEYEADHTLHMTEIFLKHCGVPRRLTLSLPPLM